MKWHTVDEVPKYDKHYLVYLENGNYVVIFFWAIDWIDLVNFGGITYWMELPEPPEIEK